jgi:hypothetical protein
MVLWDRVEDPRVASCQGRELWVPVHAAPDRYVVSNLGRMASSTRGRGWQIIEGSMSRSGYIDVGITVVEGSPSVTKRLHRVMVENFDGSPPTPDHTDVLHERDGENILHKLRWGTRSENMRQVWEHRLAPVRERERNRAATQKPTYGLDERRVQDGIRIFERGQITLDGLMDLWNCTHTVARAALVGETWCHLERDHEAIENHLGRVGDAHHKAKVTDEQLVEAFQLYVDGHWSGVQFAKYLSIPQITADSILRGRSRKYLPKPEGFQYPWPDAASMNVKRGEDHHATDLTEAQITAVFARVEEGEFSSVREVQDGLKLSKGAIYALLSGRSWPDLTRSDAFKAALSKMQRTKLTPEEQKAVVDALLVGEDRNIVKVRFNLTDAKIGFYVTKANKLRRATPG